MRYASAPVFRRAYGKVARSLKPLLHHDRRVRLGRNGMFQPAISTAVATDLLVRFPTSARARANDVGVSASRKNDQSCGRDQKACHDFNILLLNDARRQADM